MREDRRDLRQDRRDIREDRRDIREDRRELRDDRRDLRQDVQSGRALNKSHRRREIFAKTGRISGKIIGISGTIAKTGVETGETYGTTWLAAKATIVKHSDRQEKPATTVVVAGFVLSRNYSIQVFRLKAEI